jgi:nucleoside-diphosphate-sugar epimerase
MFHYNRAPAVVRPLPTAAAATSLPPPAAATALLFGSRGMMGPAAAEALGNEVGLDLIVTDLADAAEVLLDEAQLNRKRGEFVHHQTGGMKRSADPRAVAGRLEFRDLDITDNEAVVAAVADADVCINCAVVRQRRARAFRVNVSGTFFAIRAATAAGHRRFINTGPSGTVVGPGYRRMVQVNEGVPPWPGTQVGVSS